MTGMNIKEFHSVIFPSSIAILTQSSPRFFINHGYTQMNTDVLPARAPSERLLESAEKTKGNKKYGAIPCLSV
jgi:hypothetical protein